MKTWRDEEMKTWRHDTSWRHEDVTLHEDNEDAPDPPLKKSCP